MKLTITITEEDIIVARAATKDKYDDYCQNCPVAIATDRAAIEANVNFDYVHAYYDYVQLCIGLRTRFETKEMPEELRAWMSNVFDCDHDILPNPNTFELEFVEL